MGEMAHMDLESIINSSRSISDINDINEKYTNFLSVIGDSAEKRKGVYTVLVTLLYYKYLHPKQDIRQHQKQLPGGFSGRTFDTNEVTPVLKRMGLPAMAESGWLTRSLEQPKAYDFNYPGKIPEKLKIPFLSILDFIQKNPAFALKFLRFLLNRAIETAKKNKISIVPLKNPEHLTIDKIIFCLEEHFKKKYGTNNGAKLPVLAFYAIYTSLISELKRYEKCKLAPLESLKASDRTNNTSGDIEIFKDGQLFETIEIKLDKQIDEQIIRIVKDKVLKFNPRRYYVLSVDGIQEDSKDVIDRIVLEILENHGCQIIINGLLPTIKYYLRLIENLDNFVKLYSELVQNDTELHSIHKTTLIELLAKYSL